MLRRTLRVDADDSTFQRLETLGRNRTQRHGRKLFPVEGIRQINAATSHGLTLRGLIYPYDAPLSAWAKELIASTPSRENYELPLRLHARLSRKNDARPRPTRRWLRNGSPAEPTPPRRRSLPR